MPTITVITTASSLEFNSPSDTTSTISKSVFNGTKGASKVGVADVGSSKTIPSGAVHKYVISSPSGSYEAEPSS